MARRFDAAKTPVEQPRGPTRSWHQGSLGRPCESWSSRNARQEVRAATSPWPRQAPDERHWSGPEPNGSSASGSCGRGCNAVLRSPSDPEVVGGAYRRIFAGRALIAPIVGNVQIYWFCALLPGWHQVGGEGEEPAGCEPALTEPSVIAKCKWHGQLARRGTPWRRTMPTSVSALSSMKC
jgi:hypothetical protein